MSVPGAGSITHVPTYEHQAMCFEREAMQEAARIIRETEPSVLAWDGPYRCELVQVGQHAQLDPLRQSHQALAEALAAFCDDGQEARS